MTAFHHTDQRLQGCPCEGDFDGQLLGFFDANCHARRVIYTHPHCLFSHISLFSLHAIFLALGATRLQPARGTIALGQMLSNLMRWNGKRKVNKVNDDRSRRQASSPPLSPIVINIGDERASLPSAPSPCSVDIYISHSNQSWLPQEVLRSGSRALGISLGNSQRTRDNVMQSTRADMSSTPSSLRSQDTSPVRVVPSLSVHDT